MEMEMEDNLQEETRCFRFRKTKLFLLEEQRSELNEVVAPNHPSVEAGSLDLSNGHVPGFEVGDESPVRIDERVLGAAGDPEETEVCGFGIERGKRLSEVEI